MFKKKSQKPIIKPAGFYLSLLRQQKQNAYQYTSLNMPHVANDPKDILSRLSLATIGSLGMTGVFAVLSNSASNAPLKQAHIEDTLPERNAYIESVKEELLEKYPNIDIEKMDSTNAMDVLYSNYFDSYYKIDHGGWRGTEIIIKDEMKNYYIDFKNHKLDYITDTLDNMANDFEHYPLLDSLRDVVPAGLAGAVLCFAWAMYPLARAKHNIAKIDQEISLVEAELAKSNK